MVCIPSMSKDGPRGRAVISPTHRISLGLDPRAALNTAPTAKGPRVKPEGNASGWEALGTQPKFASANS
jgi:hypothetical protein